LYKVTRRQNSFLNFFHNYFGSIVTTEKVMTSQEMLKLLIEQVNSSTCPENFPEDSQIIPEVLLKSEVEGNPYYLVRCRTLEDSSIHLSPRESEIAELVAQGLPNKSIGKKLGISPWTVATYLRRIFNKLQVSTRAAMIAHLAKAHLLPE
jgi:DNA-binding CsgD family transcriptional regulator